MVKRFLTMIAAVTLASAVSAKDYNVNSPGTLTHHFENFSKNI